MKAVGRIVVVFACLWGAAHAATSTVPPLPALNDPASDVRVPGKFIWADYFTSNVDAARSFYAALFGWEWREISVDPERRYGIFYSDGEPVAGVAYRAAPDPKREYGRWVYYMSVADVAAAVRKARARGARTLLPMRNFAERGSFAVLADPEAAPFGVMHSTSGDPPDYQIDIGQWFWFSLFARDAAAQGKFYAALGGYETHAPAPDNDVLDYVLSKEGYARAGIRQLRKDSAARPTWVSYVRVDDVARVADAAVHLGGTALLGPSPDILDGELAIVADPLGAPLGLMRWTYAAETTEATSAGAQP